VEKPKNVVKNTKGARNLVSLAPNIDDYFSLITTTTYL
jgi:hypothetical protein